MKKFLKNQDAEECLFSEDVQSFIRNIAKELGISGYEQKVNTMEYKKGKGGYINESSCASFDFQGSRNIILYTDGIVKVANIFIHPYFSLDDKREILKTVICFFIAHELTHAKQLYDGRIKELKMSATQQSSGDNNNPVEKEANENAAYFIKEANLYFHEEIIERLVN